MAGKKKSSIMEEKSQPTKKSLDSVKAEAKKLFGDNCFMTASEVIQQDVSYIPTGVFTLDCLLGGGYPRGGIVEVTGPPSSGKTYLLCQGMALWTHSDDLEEQLFFTDAEQFLKAKKDWIEMARRGIDMSKVELIRAPTSVREQIIWTSKQQLPMINIIDSISYLADRDIQKTLEANKEVGDTVVAIDARTNSEFLRHYNTATTPNLKSKHWSTMIYVNHTYVDIGSYGSPEVTKGGGALRYYKEVRLDLKRTGYLDEEGKEFNTIKIAEAKKPVGQRVRVITKKNKIAAPFKVAYYDLYFIGNPSLNVPYGGIDRVKEVAEIAKKCWQAPQGWITVNGADNLRLDNLREIYKADKAAWHSIEETVKAKYIQDFIVNDKEEVVTEETDGKESTE